MVGKPSKKKKVVSQHDKQEVALYINAADLFPSNPDQLLAASKLPSIIVDLFDSINKESTCPGQVRLIQAQKRKIRSWIIQNSSDPAVIGQVDAVLYALLKIFLHPDYFPFQTAIEWVTNALMDVKVVLGYEYIQSLIEKVCVEIFLAAKKALIEMGSSDSMMIVLIKWITAFTAMVNLNRDMPWLYSNNLPKSNSVTVYEMLFTLQKIVSHIMQLWENHTISSSKLFIQLETACSHALRNISVILKQQWGLLRLNPQQQSRDSHWEELFVQLEASSDKIIRRVAFTKDVQTAAATILVILLELKWSEIQECQNLSHICRDYIVKELQHSDSTNYQCLSPIAKCAILKSFVQNFNIKDSEDSSSSTGLYSGLPLMQLYYEVIFVEIRTFCSHEDASVQLYALQAVEAWISRLKDINKSIGEEIIDEGFRFQMHQSILSIVKLLITHWEHSVRQINHIVPIVFEKLLRVTNDMLGLKPFLLSKPEQDEIWRQVLIDCIAMPCDHRGRYQSLRCLVDLGALDQSHVTLIISEVIAAVRNHNISSAASSLLCSLVDRKLAFKDISQDVFDARCSVIVENILGALCSDDESLRKNVADHLIPELLKTRGDMAPVLWKKMSDAIDNPAIVPHNILFGAVHLLLHGKMLGLIDISSVSLSANIEKHLNYACVSSDNDLRLAGLLAMVGSLKATIPLSHQEFFIFLHALPYSLKTSEIDDCLHISRAIKRFLLRAKHTVNIDSSFLDHYNFRAPENMSIIFNRLASDIKHGNGNGEYSSSLVASIKLLLSVAVEMLYPGVTFDKEYSALSVCDSIFTFCAEYKIDLRRFVGNDLVKCILNSFISNWDKSRRLSADLISLVPVPWSGYEDLTQVIELVSTAKSLAASARLRESDAGAQLLCSIYSAYCLQLGWSFSSVKKPIDVSPAVQFLGDISVFLGESLDGLDKFFANLHSFDSVPAPAPAEEIPADSFPLAHGILLAFKLCLVKTCRLKTSNLPYDTYSILQSCKGFILSQAMNSLSIAMTVVAESIADSPDPMLSRDETIRDLTGSKGPVNSSTAYSMAATYVNTNTYTNFEEGGTEVDGSLGLRAQRAVVAAWLIVKESTALLAALIEISSDQIFESAPIENDSSSAIENRSLLSSEDIERIGVVLLDALGRLKHMGAIAETHVALQAVVSKILRFSSSTTDSLACKPMQWLDSLLSRLTSHKQVFILRRSAGFAYSFLSLLRAEPANSHSVLLHHGVKTLVEVAKTGLSVDTAALVSGDSDSDLWKLSVHAMNVLRLVVLDGAFGIELDQHIPDIFILAVNGFSSTEWAVRNSSMMVFSATVQRCVSREKNNSRGTLAAAPEEFFRRYPILFTFLLDKLESITRPYVDDDASRAPPRDHDSLYPLILLFAKLKPRSVASSVSQETSEESNPMTGAPDSLDITSSFLGVIQRCQCSRNYPIREVAAKAISVLLETRKYSSFVCNLVGFLKSSFVTEKLYYNASFNEVHGILLQVLEILKQALSTGKAAHYCHESVVDQTFGEVDSLVSHLHCPTIWTTCIRICSTLRDICKGSALSSKAEAQTASSASKVIHFLSRYSSADFQRDPYAPIAVFEAHIALYSCSIFENYDVVADPEKDRREGALLGVASLFRSDPGSLSKIARHNLLFSLSRALANEKNPLLRDNQLDLVSSLLSYEKTISSRIAADLLDELWAVVSGLLPSIALATPAALSRASEEVRISGAIEVLSLLLYMTLDFDSGSHRTEIRKDISVFDDCLQRRIKLWMAVQSLASQEDQPCNTRLAATDGLFASGLLSFLMKNSNNEAAARLLLRILLSICELLQDDDDDVRASANKLANIFIHGTNYCNTQLPSVDTYSLSELASPLASLIERLTLSSGDWSSEYSTDYLCRKWRECAGFADDTLKILSIADPSNWSQKIFEAELDNLYKESIISGLVWGRCLISASAVTEATQRKDFISFFEAIANDIIRVLRDLGSVPECSIIGGWTYHRDIFRLLFLSLDLVFKSVQLGILQLQAIADLVSAADSILLNPSLNRYIVDLKLLVENR